MLLARITGTLSLLLIASCAEYLPLSGGALEGPLSATPSSWEGVAADNIIQLETRAEQPYSVNLWTVIVDGDLHIFAGDNYATWVAHIENNPAVRLQSEAGLYAFKAQRVTDEAHFKLFSQAWEGKYGAPPKNERVDQTFLFRLTSLD